MLTAFPDLSVHPPDLLDPVARLEDGVAAQSPRVARPEDDARVGPHLVLVERRARQREAGLRARDERLALEPHAARLDHPLDRLEDVAESGRVVSAHFLPPFLPARASITHTPRAARAAPDGKLPRSVTEDARPRPR